MVTFKIARLRLYACLIASAFTWTASAASIISIDDREARWDTRKLSLEIAIAAIDSDENLKPHRELIIDRAGRHSVNPLLIRALVNLNRTLEGIDRSDAERARFQLDALISSTARLYYMGRKRAQPVSDLSAADSGLNALPEAERLRLNELDAHGLEAIAQSLTNGEARLERLSQEYVRLFGAPTRSLAEEAQRMDSLRAFGAAEVTPAAAPTNFLRLPWLVGQDGWRFGGVHTNNGGCPGQACAAPRSSIDFQHLSPVWGSDTSRGRVLAAHEGTVSVFSSCNVRVTHPSGWATNYYHLDGVRVFNGQTVYAGQWISNFANNLAQATCQGGFSTGPHTHVTLIFNGGEVALDQTEFSGWRVNAGGVVQDYDTDCSRMNLSRGGYSACPFLPVKPTTPWTMHTLPATMPSNGQCAFDIDGNGAADPNTDGLLLLRYVQGIRDDALVAGALGAGATRTTGAAVASFISSRSYDLNVDNRVTTTTDGVLFLRLLRGVTGFALTRAVDTFPDYLIGGDWQIVEYVKGCR